MTLPTELAARRSRRLTVSFWAEVCTDDELEQDAVNFMSPGHWLFETLLDIVTDRCRSDLDIGAVFCDLNPDDHGAYLIWFVRTQVVNGLSQSVADLVTAVYHKADQEVVTPLPLTILDSFDFGNGEDVDEAIRHLAPMLAGRDEVVSQCISHVFLAELDQWRKQQQVAVQRDSGFIEKGLTDMIEHLSSLALDAYAEGNFEKGDKLTGESEDAHQRLVGIRDQLRRSAHLLTTAPEVLSVALVIPTPIQLTMKRPHEGGAVRMRRDPEVEQAAMDRAMEYEVHQGRTPKDRHQGNSWDIESYNQNGILQRYIEVKGRGPEDADEVWLTEHEWEAAQRLGDSYWLYIVRLADKRMWMVQDPYTKLRPTELKRWIVAINDVVPYAETLKLN